MAPVEVDTSVVELLRGNTEEVRREAGDILVKLLSNIVAEPNNTKYRQVKLANKKIEEKLLPASGAFEILFSVGFEEAEDKLVLPLGTNVRTVEKFLHAIKNLDSDSASKVVEAVPAQPAVAASVTPGPSHSSALLQPDCLTRERQFQGRLVSCLAHMETYEDTAAQDKARAVMPVQLFNTTARTKFEAARRTNPEVSEDVYRDILLLELKEWFKTDFFSWVDSPPCPTCGAATQSSGMCVATSQEQQDGAGRVEGYKCEQCGLQEVRFPRYHSRPEKLLETRRGR